MDNHSESSDYKSVHESSDIEYDSDSSVSHGFSSESEIDFDELSYDIPTNSIPQAHYLGKLKLNGPKLLSQRMETWIFSLIVRQVAENIYTTVINQLTCFVYFIHYIQGLF